MKISLVSYQQISKEVEIEFPVYYKSEYLGDNYQNESYYMVLEDGTQITISNDSEGTILWKKEKIELSTDLPDELFEEDINSIPQSIVISKNDFMKRYDKLVEKEI